MKKLISLILILCMACMLVPAMADDSVLGTWYLSEISAQGMTMSPAQLGMSMVFEFTEDGKVAVTTSYGDEAPETDPVDWAQDGSTVTLSVEGEAVMSLAFADGKLTMDQEGSTMTFTREEPVAAPAIQTIAAESEEAFFGTWELSSMEVMGIQIPVSALASSLGMEMAMTMTIEAGKATVTATINGEEPQTGEGATTLVDGQLVIKEEENELTLALTDTGDLSVVLPIEGQNFNVYLSRVTAAE